MKASSMDSDWKNEGNGVGILWALVVSIGVWYLIWRAF